MGAIAGKTVCVRLQFKCHEIIYALSLVIH